MSDFFQTGAIATLHRLGTPNVARLEAALETYAEETPIALVLPCHIRELGTKALKLITHELERVRYLKQIVVGINPSIGQSAPAKKPRLMLKRGSRKKR